MPSVSRPGSTTVAFDLSSAALVMFDFGRVVVVVVDEELDDVAPAAAVVFEVFFFVVVVVEFCVVSAVTPNTGRKRSCAVLPTRRRALSRSRTPGRSMMTLLPWRLISGSATPSASTRLRMMSTALSSDASFFTSPTGASTTEMPPWRSRPRTGAFPEMSVARKVPTTSTRVTVRNQKLRRINRPQPSGRVRPSAIRPARDRPLEDRTGRGRT